MLKVTPPDVEHYLVSLGEDDEEMEEASGLDIIQELTKEELEEEFRKLSAYNKIKFNQWVEFHDTYQRTHGIAMALQIIRYISNLSKPAIPAEVAKEELTNVDINEEQVQIIRMLGKDGKMVKKVKPILIKKELNREYASKVPFEKHPGKICFEDDK